MYEIDVNSENLGHDMSMLTSPELPGLRVLVYPGEDAVALAQEFIHRLYLTAKESEKVNPEWSRKYLTNPGLQDIECKEDIRVNIRRKNRNT